MQVPRSTASPVSCNDDTDTDTGACAALIGSVAVAYTVEDMRADLVAAGEACAAGGHDTWKHKDFFWKMSKNANVHKQRAELEDLFATVGLDCVNQGANIQRVWDSVTFSYMNVEEAQRLHSKRAIEQAQEDAEDAAKKALAAQRAADKRNRDELNKRVFVACIELAARDRVAAYTNAVCVESFTINGVPQGIPTVVPYSCNILIYIVKWRT